MADQSHGMVFFMFLNRLAKEGHLSMDKYNPRVIKMSAHASAFFLCGRDMQDQPFIGVPSGMMPFFTQMDWVEASICRREGYMFLEAKDPTTQSLLFALGFRFRPSRLDVFTIAGHESIGDKELNLKVFDQDLRDPANIIFADQHELVGLRLKEIQSTVEMGTELDAEDARDILAKSGIDRTFNIIRLSV
jgi:hypothetical protein